ncbi:MAG TPA: acyltransferase [Candidatus Dormibacteraeota bacterium]|nr:acyltransferase [Candidatus Dormibacteraeota bacterium]
MGSFRPGRAARRRATAAGELASGAGAAAVRDPVRQAGETRSASIESLRALAALGVLAGHVVGQGVGYGAAALQTYPRRVVFGGGFGVFLFFALSGYLLYRPFAVRDLGGGAAVDLRRYAANRALRILPLYGVVLVTWMIVSGDARDGADWLRFATFSESWFGDTVGKVDGVMWSLCCEVEFYALLPLAALGVARLARRDAVRAGVVLAAAGAGLLVLRTVTVTQASPSPQWRYSLPANAVFFVPGMLLAAAEVAWRRRRDLRLPGVLGSSTAWLVASAATWLVVFDDYRREWLTPLACLLAVGACVLPLRGGRALAALAWRPLALVGVASYSLYLWHFPIVSRLPQGSSASDAARLALVAVPACLALAAVSYAVVERPWLRLRRSWSPSTLAGAAPRDEAPA